MDNDVKVKIGEWTYDELVEQKGMPKPVAEATIGNEGVLLGFDGIIDGRIALALDQNIPFASASDAEAWLNKVGFCGTFPSITNLKTGEGMTIADDGTWVDEFPLNQFKAGDRLVFGMANDGFGALIKSN